MLLDCKLLMNMRLPRSFDPHTGRFWPPNSTVLTPKLHSFDPHTVQFWPPNSTVLTLTLCSFDPQTPQFWPSHSTVLTPTLRSFDLHTPQFWPPKKEGKKITGTVIQGKRYKADIMTAGWSEQSENWEIHMEQRKACREASCRSEKPEPTSLYDMHGILCWRWRAWEALLILIRYIGAAFIVVFNRKTG